MMPACHGGGSGGSYDLPRNAGSLPSVEAGRLCRAITTSAHPLKTACISTGVTI